MKKYFLQKGDTPIIDFVIKDKGKSSYILIYPWVYSSGNTVEIAHRLYDKHVKYVLKIMLL